MPIQNEIRNNLAAFEIRLGIWSSSVTGGVRDFKACLKGLRDADRVPDAALQGLDNFISDYRKQVELYSTHVYSLAAAMLQNPALEWGVDGDATATAGWDVSNVDVKKSVKEALEFKDEVSVIGLSFAQGSLAEVRNNVLTFTGNYAGSYPNPLEWGIDLNPVDLIPVGDFMVKAADGMISTFFALGGSDLYT
ncbi:hypothetical protein ACTVZO_00470 [Streptomyces sp. IBSNAI002]|uniref:hypothetical protein n=1 Tax=Streptomyces sp. IBSNAI002 TaxID=3457500 RepID=UPI003FD223C7